MGQKSKIEWTDRTWNPVTGCTKVSQGCKNCYAERISVRFNRDFDTIALKENRLFDPLRWQAPSKVFVNSMSDLFHEDVPFDYIDKVFAIMILSHKHSFQILTKRPERMLEYLRHPKEVLVERWENACYEIGLSDKNDDPDAPACAVSNICERTYPVKNIWLGVSVEDQKSADLRIPMLLDTPAAVRFLSCEPLLGPLSLKDWFFPSELLGFMHDVDGKGTGVMIRQDIHWVIVGGESGHRARQMHPDWVRNLRNECTAHNIPFFFKQWGEWVDKVNAPEPVNEYIRDHWKDKNLTVFNMYGTDMYRIGKTKAGTMLDGIEWKQWPNLKPA